MRKRKKLDFILTEQYIYEFFTNLFNDFIKLLPEYLQKHTKYKFTKQDDLIVCKLSYLFESNKYEVGIVSYSVHIGNWYLPNCDISYIYKNFVRRMYSNIRFSLVEEEQDFILSNLDILNISNYIEFYNKIYPFVTGKIKVKLASWILIEKMANSHKSD